MKSYRNKFYYILFVPLFALIIFLESAAGQGWKPAEGVTVEGTYIGDFFSNFSGGDSRGTVYLHNIDLTATFDVEEMGGWQGGTLFLYGLNLYGGNPAGIVGDAQGVNNIEAGDAFRLYEAWYEQILFEGRLSILGGLYGLDSEFDVINSASLFINSSHGTGPDLSQSGRNGPSIFPFTAPALRLRVSPIVPLAIQVAIVDGVPAQKGLDRIALDPDDGFLIAAETSYLFPGTYETDTSGLRRRRVSRTGTVPYSARIAIGAWAYSKSYNSLAAMDLVDLPEMSGKSRGIYALAEGQVYRENADPSQGLSLYARVGFASQHVNRFSTYTGAGGVYTGLFSGRSSDQLGLGIAAAHNGDPYQEAIRELGDNTTSSEVNIELTYLAQLAPWLTLQGDLQHVINPNTDPTFTNATAATVRLVITP
ncbi:MAG: carbohydrate porin [Balneolaceae bacterium]|nr:carbohydrate porin [Balneolaceae bacterium]